MQHAFQHNRITTVVASHEASKAPIASQSAPLVAETSAGSYDLHRPELGLTGLAAIRIQVHQACGLAAEISIGSERRAAACVSGASAVDDTHVRVLAAGKD